METIGSLGGDGEDGGDKGGDVGEVVRLCEHLCDCDLVIWKTFKGATAGLVSPPCISMFAFVFAAAVSRPVGGREARKEAVSRRVTGNNSQHARSVASPRRWEKREREEEKKEKRKEEKKPTRQLPKLIS